MSYQIEYYETENGKIPFYEALRKLKDPSTKAIIARAIDRLEKGTTSNIKALRNGVFEIKINTGPGYRIYFAFTPGGSAIIFLVGIKKTQHADIVKAIKYWDSYRTRMYS